MISLSKQYLESGECNTHESREDGTAQRQTIHATAATQVSKDGTNYRASRHRLPSAGTNQPGKFKISSGSRGASAQTEATNSEACLCEDEVDSAGQHRGHKIDLSIGSGSEGTDLIAAEEIASIRGFGGARTTIRLAQHSEAPKLSPQRTEFLDTFSNSTRYESILPPRRDRSSAHNRTEELSKPGRNQSSAARLDNKFSAPASRQGQNQRQVAMRVETSPHREWNSHDDDLVKLAATYQWGDQSNPKKRLRDADSLLSQPSSQTPQQGHRANDQRPIHQQLHNAPGITADRQTRSNFLVGQARMVKMSKPGEPRLVKVPTKKSRPFNINCLSSEEADLMASMGTIARSSRRSSAWTDDEQSREGRSSDIDAAAETVVPKRDGHKSRLPRAIPRAKEGAARPSKQTAREEPRDGPEDVRFHQLVGRLGTNDRETSRDVCHPPAQGMSRMDRRQEAEQSEMPIIHDQGLMIINPSFDLEPKQRCFSLNDPIQRRSLTGDDPVRFRQLVRRLKTDYPESTLPSAIPADKHLNPRDSGCPSLISDDGRESSASPGDMPYEYARAQIFQDPYRIDGWETDDAASTVAPHEAPSQKSLDLFDISTDENGLVSGADTSENQADEKTSDGNGRGRWYQDAREVASYYSFHQGNLFSRVEERRRGARTTGTQPQELSLYTKCALLRWMHSTTDAPDTPGMHDESGRWWELLNVKDTYQLRYGDETRAEILRELRSLSGAEEPRPEPSLEVQASLGEMFPPSAP